MTVKYSKTMTSAAGGFLTDYHLTLEQLTDAQQKQVIGYIRVRKGWPWAAMVLLAATIIFGCVVWTKYTHAQDFLQQAIVMSHSDAQVDLLKFSSIFLEQGILIGFCLMSIGYMILFIIMMPIHLRDQKRLLNAFLSTMAPKSTDASDKQT